MKKIFKAGTLALIITLFLQTGTGLLAQSISPKPVQISASEEVNEKVPITIFKRDDCKHCKEQKEFLDELQKRRSDFSITFIDVQEEEGKKLWLELAEIDKLSKVTPITLVGNTIVQGFGSAETTGVLIEQLIDQRKGKENFSIEAYIAAGGNQAVAQVSGEGCDEDGVTCGIEPPPGAAFLIDVPLYGVVDVGGYSLPILSVILGFVDGFNPCAMWVLVTFLILIMQTEDRRKMWTLAGLFILAETVMYYLILNFWAQTWDFVGLDAIITPIIGFVAIGGGIFFLYEWYKADGTCKVMNHNQRSKTVGRIKRLVEAELTLATTIGVLLLAFSVNIIEFACSIGIPQTFTKILDLNGLDFWGQQVYMLIYILFYMIDDFIVFGIALYGFEKLHLTAKYSKWSNFIGGILMLILGAILIIDPEILVF